MIAIAIPLLPGKSEAWRRWVQELQSGKPSIWRAFAAGASLHVRFWILEACGEEVVVGYFEVQDPNALDTTVA